MAVTYTVSTSASSMLVGRDWSSKSGVDTYKYYRGYVKFDLSGAGLSVDDIATVVLRAYCYSKNGADATHRLRSGSAGDNWGATLTASEADFLSTDVNIEQDIPITGTGWKEWTVDKTHLDLAGWTYFRLADIGEGSHTTSYCIYYTQDNATNRPVLRITLVDPSVIIEVDSLGMTCVVPDVQIGVGAVSILVDCISTAINTGSITVAPGAVQIAIDRIALELAIEMIKICGGVVTLTDGRGVKVSADDRLILIPAEDRIAQVPADDRLIQIKAE